MWPDLWPNQIVCKAWSNLVAMIWNIQYVDHIFIFKQWFLRKTNLLRFINHTQWCTTTRLFQQSKAGIIVSILNQSYLLHIIIKDYLISKGNKKLFLKDYTQISKKSSFFQLVNSTNNQTQISSFFNFHIGVRSIQNFHWTNHQLSISNQLPAVPHL